MAEVKLKEETPGVNYLIACAPLALLFLEWGIELFTFRVNRIAYAWVIVIACVIAIVHISKRFTVSKPKLARTVLLVILLLINIALLLLSFMVATIMFWFTMPPMIG